MIPTQYAEDKNNCYRLSSALQGTMQMAGWEVHEMGNDVADEELISKAVEIDAVIIGALAMMYNVYTAENIIKLRQAIDAAGLKKKVHLAVGGATFKLRPGMVQEVDGGGTAYSTVNTPRLSDSLLDAILNLIGIMGIVYTASSINGLTRK